MRPTPPAPPRGPSRPGASRAAPRTPGRRARSMGEAGRDRVERVVADAQQLAGDVRRAGSGQATWSGRSLWRRSNATTVVGRPRAQAAVDQRRRRRSRGAPRAPTTASAGAAPARCAAAVRSTLRSSGSSAGGSPMAGFAMRAADRAQVAGARRRDGQDGLVGQLGGQVAVEHEQVEAVLAREPGPTPRGSRRTARCWAAA